MKRIVLLFFVASAFCTANAKSSVSDFSHVPTSLVAEGDTVRAITNLFHRKRTGGNVRSAIFIPLTASGIATGANGGEDGNFLLAGVFGVFAITGITQTSKYSKEKLQVILDNYQKGIPIPAQYKKKLKKKDFE